MSKIKELKANVIEYFLNLEGKYIEDARVEKILSKLTASKWSLLKRLHSKLSKSVTFRVNRKWHRKADAILASLENVSAQDMKTLKLVTRNELDNALNDRALNMIKVQNRNIEMNLRTSIALTRKLQQTIGVLGSVQGMATPADHGHYMHVVEGENTRKLQTTLTGEKEEVPLNVLKSDTVVLYATGHRTEAEWSDTAIADCVVPGLDISRELPDIISHEMSDFVVAETLQEIKNSAPVIEVDFSPETMFKVPLSFIGDVTQPLVEALKRAYVEIGTDSKRGIGNFIVCDPVSVSILQSSSLLPFRPATEDEAKSECNSYSGLKFAGYVGDPKVKVYITIGFGDHNFNDGILVGYRGTEIDTDVGLVFGLYVPFIERHQLSPVTFNLHYNGYSRYDRKLVSPNYFRFIKYSPVEQEKSES